MSTDRELLEMAGKAANMGKLDFDYAAREGHGFYFGPRLPMPQGVLMAAMHTYWDPLGDDADAFRLLRQVDYGLLVEDGIVKIMNNLGGCVLYLDIRDADEMTVIRRAITMAAAAAWRPGVHDGR